MIESQDEGARTSPDETLSAFRRTVVARTSVTWHISDKSQSPLHLQSDFASKLAAWHLVTCRRRFGTSLHQSYKAAPPSATEHQQMRDMLHLHHDNAFADGSLQKNSGNLPCRCVR